MKNFLFALTFVLLISSCTTTDDLFVVEGIVTDLSGTPITLATISIGRQESAVTGTDGYFCYEGLQPSRNVLVEIRKKGYAPAQRQLARSAYRLDVKLSLQARGGTIDVNNLPEDVGDDFYCRSAR